MSDEPLRGETPENVTSETAGEVAGEPAPFEYTPPTGAPDEASTVVTPAAAADEAGTLEMPAAAPYEASTAQMPAAAYVGTPAPADGGRRRRVWPRAAAIAAVVAAALFSGAALSHQFWPANESHTPISQPQPGFPNAPDQGLPYGNGDGSGSSSGSDSSASIDVQSIAAKVSPALVDINVKSDYSSGQGAATGIVLTSDGLVLTSNHVIDGITDITATDVGNGQTYTATVLGYDVGHDIALLQLQDASGLATATIGDSSTVSVGQAVVGIGNAGGQGGTPSVVGGTVTALDQQIVAGDQRGGNAEQLSGLIQTDAGIQPGDSGGPLVNTDGEVIGVLAAASATNGYYQGGDEGYAVPIDTAMDIVEQIKSGQSSDTVHVGETGFLGVSVTDGSGGYGGATVADVASGSPADQAGIAAGDVITSVGGQTVDSAEHLTQLVGAHHPGDEVQITWTDTSGQEHTQTVTLAAGPAK